MTELTFLIIGILIGGCFGATTMCCFQLNRVNAYEAELHKTRRLKTWKLYGKVTRPLALTAVVALRMVGFLVSAWMT